MVAQRRLRMPLAMDIGVTILPEAASTTRTDWFRLAEPQQDQYDTDVILRLASSAISSGGSCLTERTLVDEGPTIFDGQVAICHVYRSWPKFQLLLSDHHLLDGPADHPNISSAAEHIRSWPVAYTQCQRLLVAIHPVLDPQFPLESSEIYRGSLCHSYEHIFGTMWATIFCPIGLAEAIVREMAHQKLRVLGVSLEAATTIVNNDPFDLYASPINNNRLQPMTAVLHATYAYVHVAALDIHLLKAERNSDRRAVISQVLDRNLARVEKGFDVILKHFEPGKHGREFIEGFYTWTESVIRSAEELLGRRFRRPAHLEPAAFRMKRNHNFRMPAASRDARTPVLLAYNGGIGDHLCNLPAVRALTALFCGRLALVCGKGDWERYYSNLDLRAIHEIEFRMTGNGWIFDAETLARLIENCDLFLSINPWHTRSVTDLLTRIRNVESIGFFAHYRHRLTCDYTGHAIDMAFAIPASLNRALKLDDFSQPPAIPGSAVTTAQEFRRRHIRTRRSLFVHTETRVEKRWQRERFERVLDDFLQEFPDYTALVVDIPGYELRGGQHSDRALSLSLSLETTFALLRDCDLFLGIDSCHLHAADLFRIPGVGLFGPTTCRRWGFRFSNHRHLQGGRTMDSLDSNDVYEALRSLARSACGGTEQATESE
jgi:ADP-heptose:LPS heptosyltransferase